MRRPSLFTLLPFSRCPSDFLIFFGADGILVQRLFCGFQDGQTDFPAHVRYPSRPPLPLSRLGCFPQGDAENPLRGWRRKGEVCTEGEREVCTEGERKIKDRSSRCPRRARSLGGRPMDRPRTTSPPAAAGAGVELRRVEGQPEMSKHPLDAVTRCERGGDLHAAVAACGCRDVPAMLPAAWERSRGSALSNQFLIRKSRARTP
jgi:hypothetical protein